MQLKVGLARTDGTVRLELSGDIDMATAELLAEGVAQAVAVGATLVVLDMREVAFIDSTGLATILAANAASRRGTFDLAIVQPQDRVMRVFDVSGTTELLPIVHDESFLGSRFARRRVLSGDEAGAPQS
jgi:anti-sigma B factor antagonist